MSGFPQNLALAPLQLETSNPASTPLAVAGVAGQSGDLFQAFLGPGFINKAVSINSQGALISTAVPAINLVPGSWLSLDASNGSVVGEVNSSNQFLLDSAVGDTCFRAGAGKILRLGVGATTSTMQIGATSIGLKNLTTGIGNGASTNLTALAIGTGTGPASDAVNAWVPITIGATSGWIPFFT